ncbi:uncharacterized protein TRIADDRAFT_59907 [Trichoplax adhaerens]|uniref:Prolyl 4-hydroxylase N-terminal domain-containing protein n=1 Tax=Trichoplax adhaerens TaxID=10228 RepID=B3S6S1_TRIAD|nr:hypothetical protein TRIADDRAFT_59907 [Trichoplax adhaerens]EDV21670.1 hypothetical protein TRIADDRAFT_59907 [Trichoplax adhaerens]|eukprot:XP_002115818.1 hypothetical protein TRIADDRAFT_59907 [Trichoplax adhaerens]
MLKFALLLIFFLLANIQFHGIWGDNVRSIDDMDKLLKMEKTLYSSLKSYVQMEKQRLNKISDLYQEITDELSSTYKNLQDYFPEEKDLNETANAILRLQEVYDLTEENLANGKIAGIKNAINSLNWKDCLLISQVAESNGLFNRSCRWAQQALYQLPLQEYNDTNFPVHDLKTVLKRIITIFYTTGQTREARMYIQKLLRLGE